jgi:hypothetical protein
MSLIEDYEAFIESERRNLNLKPCSAPDDYHTACHVTNVNAAYNGSCLRCTYGGAIAEGGSTDDLSEDWEDEVLA